MALPKYADKGVHELTPKQYGVMFGDIVEPAEMEVHFRLYIQLQGIDGFSANLDWRGDIQRQGDTVRIVETTFGEQWHPLLCDKAISIPWDKGFLPLIAQRLVARLLEQHGLVSQWEEFASTVKYSPKDSVFTLIYGLKEG